MKINITLTKLDALSSVFWFIMDFFWMLNAPGVGMFFYPTIVAPIFISFVKSKNQDFKKIMVVTFLWFNMNYLWMASDVFKDQILVIKTVACCFGALGLLILFYLLFFTHAVQYFRRLRI